MRHSSKPAEMEQVCDGILRAEHALLAQGTGSHWPSPDHFRIVLLPGVRGLEEVGNRMAGFLAGYRQA
jgi:alanine-synthesizing transaminase